MSETEKMADPEADVAASGPGERLRMAREQRGISIAEVAAELRLSQALVTALERDDYASLPPTPFVRGYLRSSARLLGIDGDELVAAFDAASGEAPDTEIVAPSTGGDRLLLSPRAALLGVLALAAGGAGAWWYVGDPVGLVPEQAAVVDDEPAEAEEVERVDPEVLDERSGEEAAVEPPVVVYPEVIIPDLETDPERIAERDAEIEAMFEETPVEGEAGEPLPGDADEDDVAVEDDPPAAEPDDDELADAGEEAEQDAGSLSETAEEALAEAAGSGPDRMTLRVEGETWVEIHDGQDRRLVYTLYTGDEVLEVQGWAPFEVFLGNAPAVELDFEGEPVDAGDFIQPNDTARFRVDADGASAP